MRWRGSSRRRGRWDNATFTRCFSPVFRPFFTVSWPRRRKRAKNRGFGVKNGRKTVEKHHVKGWRCLQVLLQNERAVLPLDPTAISSIAVIGGAAAHETGDGAPNNPGTDRQTDRQTLFSTRLIRLKTCWSFPTEATSRAQLLATESQRLTPKPLGVSTGEPVSWPITGGGGSGSVMPPYRISVLQVTPLLEKGRLQADIGNIMKPDA